LATKKGYLEIVDILLKHGAKPDVIDGVSVNNQHVHYTSMFT